MFQFTEPCPFCPLDNPITSAEEHSDECERYRKYLEMKAKRLEAMIQGSLMSPEQEIQECISVCRVCFNNYDEVTYLPKILPSCGHTFCSKCLESIESEEYRLSCPICRFKYRQPARLFPTNLALLGVKNVKVKDFEQCKVHSMKLMAFCEDDQKLLCGACVIEHKNHSCKLLSDESLDTQVSKAKQKLMNRLQFLYKEQSSLAKQNLQLHQKISEIETEVIRQRYKISECEEKTMNFFKNNTEKCINEIREIPNLSKIEAMEMCYDFNIKLFNDDIQKLENKLQDFDQLMVAEKLTKVELKSVQQPFISVNEIVEDVFFDKMREVDYWKSISSGKICIKEKNLSAD